VRRVVPNLFYVADNVVQDAAVAKAVVCTAGHFEQLADDQLIKSTPYLDLALKPFDDVTLSSQTVCRIECGLSRVITMITHALMQSTGHSAAVRYGVCFSVMASIVTLSMSSVTPLAQCYMAVASVGNVLLATIRSASLYLTFRQYLKTFLGGC